jgi:Anti-sigma factor NepR
MQNDHSQFDSSAQALNGEKDSPELDPKIQGLLGRALQSHYQDLISTPVPDRFLVLLAELEAKEKRDE